MNAKNARAIADTHSQWYIDNETNLNKILEAIKEAAQAKKNELRLWDIDYDGCDNFIFRTFKYNQDDLVKLSGLGYTVVSNCRIERYGFLCLRKRLVYDTHTIQW